MRIINTLLFSLLLITAGYGQAYEVISAPTGRAFPKTTTPAKSLGKTQAVLNLPFTENFSQRTNFPLTSRWADSLVYVNQTMAKLPPTLGVATFDGLDKFGQPYDISRNTTGSCDTLTSHYINMSSTADSVYFSFYWQQAGFGEKPSSADSLRLEFWSKPDSAWIRVWGQLGTGNTIVDSFKLEHFPVLDNVFLTDSFRFRFRSYGSRAGGFDLWHIDEIRLDDQRTYDDTLFTDISYLYPHQSLLIDYQSIPWFHYNNQIAVNFNEQNLEYVYQRNSAGVPFSLNLGIYNISYNGTSIASDLVGNPTFDNGHQQNEPTPFNFNIGNFFPSGFSPAGPFTFEAYSTYTGFNDALRSYNDTCYRSQVFDNYYAYDDGSAERAYGITNATGPTYIVNKYDLLIDGGDTLRGLSIYFMPSITDPSENSFTIAIFENNSNIPGDLIYESEMEYTPQLSEMNAFRHYELDTAIKVPESCFIGIKQTKVTRMNLGFDVNDTNKTITFFTSNGQFYQSFNQGTVMMRPFFRYLPNDISIKENVVQKTHWNIYPNPGAHTIYIDVDEHLNDPIEYNIFNLSGQRISTGTTLQTIDVSLLPEGLYLLQLQHGKRVDVQKIMIKR